LAELYYPDLYKALPGHSATFQWSSGKNVEEYYLMVGTTGAGSANVFDGSTGTTQNQLVSGIPIDGSNVYVRLSSKINGQWCYNDYIYTGFSYALAEMTSPTPGSRLSGSSATFQWTAGLNVDEYCLEVGTTAAGANDVFSGYTTDTSQGVGGIPRNGCTIYVRLWSGIPGHPSEWLYNDYTYTAYNLCGYNWTQTTTSQGGFGFNGMAFNGSLYVGAGECNHDDCITGGLIMTCPDVNLVNWTLRDSKIPKSIKDIIYAEGKFVAVGNRRTVTTSTNGISWTLRKGESATGAFYAIAHDGSQFVAVGGTGGEGRPAIYTSPAAITWTQQTSIPTVDIGLMDIVYANGLFVACGNGGYVYTSANGTSWSSQRIGVADGAQHLGITYGGGKFLIVGKYGLSYYSTNGTSWTKGNAEGVATAYMYSLCYIDNKFVVPCGDGTVLTSDDGINFINRPTTAPHGLFAAFADISQCRAIVMGPYKNVHYSTCDCDCD
jgi:hypothetical protein